MWNGREANTINVSHTKKWIAITEFIQQNQKQGYINKRSINSDKNLKKCPTIEKTIWNVPKEYQSLNEEK